MDYDLSLLTQYRDGPLEVGEFAIKDQICRVTDKTRISFQPERGFVSFSPKDYLSRQFFFHKLTDTKDPTLYNLYTRQQEDQQPLCWHRDTPFPPMIRWWVESNIRAALPEFKFVFSWLKTLDPVPYRAVNRTEFFVTDDRIYFSKRGWYIEFQSRWILCWDKSRDARIEIQEETLGNNQGERYQGLIFPKNKKWSNDSPITEEDWQILRSYFSAILPNHKIYI